MHSVCRARIRIIQGGAFICAALAVFIVPQMAVAEQANLRLKIKPLACALDVTAIGSGQTVQLTPETCQTVAAGNAQSSRTMQDALRFRLPSNNPANSRLPYGVSAPIRSDSPTEQIRKSSPTEVNRVSQIAIAGGVAFGAALIVDGVLFNFAAAHGVSSSAQAATTSGARKAKSVFGKLLRL